MQCLKFAFMLCYSITDNPFITLFYLTHILLFFFGGGAKMKAKIHNAKRYEGTLLRVNQMYIHDFYLEFHYNKYFKPVTPGYIQTKLCFS